MLPNADELKNFLTSAGTGESESSGDRGDGLLRTRLFAPQHGGRLINRSGKMGLGPMAATHRLVLVRAPAGYGKTTSLADCYWELTGAGHHTAWMSLGDFDGSMYEFVRYLDAAWNPGHASRLEQDVFLQQVNNYDSLVVRFCELLATIPGPSYLFLDDFHSLLDTEAEKFVASLIKVAPDNLHVLIGSRSMVAFGVGRLRALGQLAEVGTDVLRFSPEEVRQLLLTTGSTDITPDLAEIAMEKTEGWAVGLQLLGVALRKNQDDQAAFLASFSGTNRTVGAFLIEEVLSKLPPDIYDFLVGTSILGRFCAPLCDDVLRRKDSTVMLKGLEQSGLFLFSLDEDECWYRYHHLFSEHLLKRLHETAAADEPLLRKRASNWFNRNGYIEEAIEHSLAAEDFDVAAQLLDDAWEGMQNSARYWVYFRMTEGVPSQILDRHPMLSINRASALILARKFDEVRPAHESVFRWLKSPEAETDPDFVQKVWFNLRVNDMLFAQLQDDIPSVEQICTELLNDPPAGANHNLLGVLATSLISAKREQYRLDDLDQMVATALRYFQTAKSEASLVWNACIVGPTLLLRGKAAAARVCYEGAINRARKLTGVGSPLIALPSLLMAELHLECVELDSARALIAAHLHLGREMGFVDNLIAGYMTRARLEAFEGDYQAADAAITEGLEIAKLYRFDRMAANLYGERIRFMLAKNEIDEAIRAGREAKLPAMATDLLPGNGTTSLHETLAIAWIRLALNGGDYAGAIAAVRRWLSFAEGNGCIRTQIRMGILAAKVHLGAGENKAAMRYMLRAIEAATKSGLSFPLLEEGPPVLDLLSKALDAEGEQGASRDALQQRVARFIDRRQDLGANITPILSINARSYEIDESPREALTSREIEILKLAGQGLLVKQIADRVGMTEGSVKWALHQVYGKLGVGRRLAAIQRASQLGFLN